MVPFHIMNVIVFLCLFHSGNFWMFKEVQFIELKFDKIQNFFIKQTWNKFLENHFRECLKFITL